MQKFKTQIKHLPKINITIKIHFRWRGENVSTIEVESILSNVLQQQDTIVYGVQVPGVEGRAGMAAIVQPEGGIDLNWFLSAIKNQLPSYAMPIFLRMVKELDITGMHNYIIQGLFIIKMCNLLLLWCVANVAKARKVWYHLPGTIGPVTFVPILEIAPFYNELTSYFFSYKRYWK